MAGTGDIATYDPRSVVLTIGGQIITGFSDKTFIKAQRNGELWTNHVGIDGQVTRVKNNDKSGKVSITLKQNSPSNNYLHSLGDSGKITYLSVTDNNFDNFVGIQGSKAWVTKQPPFERGKEVGDAEWELFVADYTQAFRSNTPGTENSY